MQPENLNPTPSFNPDSFVKKCQENIPLTLSKLKLIIKKFFPDFPLNENFFKNSSVFIHLIIAYHADLIHLFEQIFLIPSINFINQKNFNSSFEIPLKKISLKKKKKWIPIPFISPEIYFNLLQFRDKLISHPENPEQIFFSIPLIKSLVSISFTAQKETQKQKYKALRKHHILQALDRIAFYQKKIQKHLKEIFETENLPQSLASEIEMLDSARKNLTYLVKEKLHLKSIKNSSYENSPKIFPENSPAAAKTILKKARKLFHHYYLSLVESLPEL